MHIGIQSMNGTDGLRPADLARAVEERGFESLWVGEHNHIPANIVVDYPELGSLPHAYKTMLDPYVSLAAAATVTSRLRLGTGIALPLERPVLLTAKDVSTLDFLSTGRLCMGIGVGWIREELANLTPIPWSARYRALREYVMALRQLWAEEEAAFEGEFVNFGSVWSFPKPTQTPHPPILMGGTGPLAIKHAAEWADGWFPSDIQWDDPAAEIGKFRQAVSEAGRNPADVQITIGSWLLEHSRLDRYRELGVHRVVLSDKDVLMGVGDAKQDSYGELSFLDRLSDIATRYCDT